VLDRLRDENKGHSGFIAHLLNPKANHYQGTLYLESFLATFFRDQEFTINESWEVVTEESVSGTGTDDDLYGRVDIWLSGPDDVIVIENKIDAGDQDRQIERYVDYAKAEAKGRNIYVVYLTLDGKNPENHSLGKYANGKLEREDLIYICASYYEQVYEWTSRCLKDSASLPEIRETLAQYRKTIRKITGRLSDEELGMSLDGLLEGREEIIAAMQLGKAAGEKLDELEVKFWNKLTEGIKRMISGELKFLNTGNISGRYYGVSVKVADDATSELRFNIERDRNSGVLYPGLRQTPINSEKFDTARQFSAPLKHFANPILKNWPSNNYWLGWGDFQLSSGFNPDAENFIGYVDENKMESVVNTVITESRKVIKQLDTKNLPEGVNVTVAVDSP
jgi:hypothetical protein